MTDGPARPWLALLFLLPACATTVPLQTASTVPAGVVRLSGQAASSVWCSFSGLDSCAYAPEDGLALPELRLNGRVGVHDRVDLGLSAFTTLVFESGVRWGGLLDGKVEVWRSELAPGRKQLVSAGLGVGLTWLDDADDDSSWSTDASYLQMDLVLPVRYGYQFESIELVVGPQFIERLAFDAPEIGGVAQVPWLGLAVGFTTRGRARFGLEVSYEAPLRYFGDGAINVAVGFLYDLGGKDARSHRDSAVRDPQVPAAVQVGQER